MNKLTTRLERLERRHDMSAEEAQAARQFAEQMGNLIDRMAPEEEHATASQMERWSPAKRTAWRIRFKDEDLDQALTAIGWPMPRDGVGVALSGMDELDWEL